MKRHLHRYLVLISASVLAAASVTNGAESALEVRCGVVYSLHSRAAYGNWINSISSAMGTGWPDMLMMTYAPFVAVTNHAAGPMTLADTARVEFDQPKLGLRFKRIGNSKAGFVSGQSIPLTNMYVSATTVPTTKRFTLKLFGGASGELPPSGQAVVGAGQTLVFSPWMPSAAGLDQVLDWQNNLTLTSIPCVPEWKGSANGYCVNWMGGVYYSPISLVNGGLGVIATRPLDSWDVEIQTVGSLAGCRVFRPNTGAAGNWPWQPDPSLEVTAFPFNYTDSQPALSTAGMRVSDTALVNSWTVAPIFSVVLPPAATKLLYKDANSNGIDDDWELLYFGAVNVNKNADQDNDGHTNLYEFLAGSSPRDATDFVRTSLTQENGDWRLEWSSAPQRTYVVEASEDLDEWVPVATVTALGTTCSHSLGASLGNARYLRLQIVPPI